MLRRVRGLAVLPLVAGLLAGTSAVAAPGSICWRHVPSPNGIDTLPNYLHAVDGASPNDVWTVGLDQGVFPNEALIEHWDGTSWAVNAQISIGSGGTALYAVHAISSTDVWAVGYYDGNNPLVEHWDGTGWFLSSTPIAGVYNVLFSISAVSSSDIWAVGQYWTGTGPNLNLAFHYDGTSWAQFTVPSPGAVSNQLNGVSALSADDVWAVGSYLDQNNTSYPLTVHWDGTRWSTVPSPAIAQNILTGITAVSTDDVWAVGDGLGAPLSIHWGGTSWVQVIMPKVGVEDYMHGIDASSSTDVWAVGEASPNSEDWRALAERWNGSSWVVAKISEKPSLATHFLGVGELDRGNLWAVGYWEAGIDSTFTEHLTTC